MQKLKDLDFRVTNKKLYRVQGLTVFEKFWLPCTLTSKLNPPRCCSKGLESNQAKTAT